MRFYLFAPAGEIMLHHFYMCIPSATPLSFPKAGGWGVVGKRSVKASGSLSSLWIPTLRGDVSLESSKFSHTLQMASTYGKHNVSLTAALNTVDKVGGGTGPLNGC